MLRQDVPIPTFFQEKKEEEWTDEERRAAVEYQKKVKELEEEREKFRKVVVYRVLQITSCLHHCYDACALLETGQCVN